VTCPKCGDNTVVVEYSTVDAGDRACCCCGHQWKESVPLPPAVKRAFAACRRTDRLFRRGWGVRVNGPCPYLAWEIHPRKVEAVEGCTEPYHRPVKVVLVPLEWYRRAKGKIEEND